MSTPTARADLLLIDAGNTRLKWAAHDGISLQPMQWCGTQEDFAVMRQFALDCGARRAVISNVAGQAVRERIADALEHVSSVVFISALPSCAGVRNRYTDPAQLGSDRFAALIAAHAMGVYRDAAKLVVMAGTALTVDALTANGEFLGGVIAPGVATMRQSLNRATAQLPLVNTDTNHDFPRDTNHAIALGTLEAAIGVIRMRLEALATTMKVAMKAEHAQTPIVIVLSGGAAPMLAPVLSRIDGVALMEEPAIVLSGLAVIATHTRHRADDSADDASAISRNTLWERR